MSRLIAVYGSSTISQDSEEARRAFDVGRRLAARGAEVMNGGYGGVMEAVSRGARVAGGKVIGVTVKTFLDRKCNPHLSVEHAVPDLLERLRVLTTQPDGFLALPGGIGTAAEIFLVWNLLWMKLRPAAPLVVLGAGFRELLRPGRDGLGIPEQAFEMIQFATDPEEAVEKVLAAS